MFTMLLTPFLLNVALAETTLYVDKYWSFFRDAEAIDANDQLVYKLQHKYWTIGLQFDINNAQNKTILEARERFWGLAPCYNINYKPKGNVSGDWKQAKLRMHFISFGRYGSFDIYDADEKKFTSHADFLRWHLKVNDGNGTIVAEIAFLGQEIVRISIPHMQTRKITVQDNTIDPCLMMAAMNIIEYQSYRRSKVR
jgi:uncharacterized protein YxjI